MITVKIKSPKHFDHRFQFDLCDEDEFIKVAMNYGIYQTCPRYNEGSITLTASGKSLEKIKEMFTNLPMVNLQTVIWSGDHATFILENLRTYAFELTPTGNQLAHS